MIQKVDDIENVVNNYLQITVKDTGAGIEFQEQDKLFQLFKLVEKPDEMRENGIGLSLAVINQIVQQFDGYMTFDSIPNQGSNFTFTFKIESRVGEVQDLMASSSFKFRWKPNPEQFIGGQEIRYILKQGNVATNPADQTAAENQVFAILPYKNEVNMVSNQQSYTMLPMHIDDVKRRLQKILIVDDEAYNINALIILLEIILKIDVQSTCERALSGPEAIQKIKDDLRANNN